MKGGGTLGISDAQTAHRTHGMIEELWKSMPKPVKEFFLETPLEFLTLRRISAFWSSPPVVEYIWNLYVGRANDASLTIALNYLYLGKVREARAVLLNGCFILDCKISGIDTIMKLCRETVDVPCTPALKYFSHAYYSANTPQAMEFLLQRMMREHKSLQVEATKAGGRIGNYLGNSIEKHHEPSKKTSTGELIQVILADDANAEERKVLTIGSSTNLKVLFNDYSEQRGISLRLLRFSYNGKTLFLSSAGNRTPDDLKMKDQDVITVRNLSNISLEASEVKNAKKIKATPKKNAKRHNNSRKKTKGNRKKEDVRRKEAVKTLEEYRSDHSKLLSKLHEEAQSQLKEIRMRLNGLALERQPPKQKRRNGGRNKDKGPGNDLTVPPNLGVGGKAGRPCFLVNIGEVQNLYKTTKSPQDFLYNAPTLDLHGCTNIEALHKLDESLPVWVDTAMQGSYPFVMSAKIVCGCGNQVLSETVENWIRKNTQVANCPKRGC